MTQRDRVAYRILITLGILSTLAFYGWWLLPEHYPTNLVGAWHGVDLVIYGLLTLVISHRVFMDAFCWVVARRITPFQDSPAPQPGLRVAFITTFVPGAEGIDLLQRTLPAMLRADYPHDVWLLDEGDDPEARELCENLGVHHFTRHDRPEYNHPAGPFTRRTKGGNHNAWYDAHGHVYDVVAQIDTDFLPRRDFLTQTLGHFADETIGWVTTPQIYGNTQRLIARGAAEQQFTFYGPVLRGLSARGMANMLGANHVVRVAALKEIGYYAGHVTEDLLTGMRLHARGWRSAYVPLPLAVGEGPDSWKAYFTQQHRWAFGCMDILGRHTRALVREMPRSWRWLYLSLQQGYFSGIAAAVGVGLLSLYFLAGVEISDVPLLPLLAWGAPFFVMRHAIRLWLQRFNVRPDQERGLHVAGGLVAIAAWPIYLIALVRVLRGQSLTFKVTPKGRSVSKVRGGTRTPFRPHAAIAALNVVCIGAAVALDRFSGALVAWAAVNVVLLGGMWLLPQRLGAARLPAWRTPAMPVLAPVHGQRSGADPAVLVSVGPGDGRPDGRRAKVLNLVPRQRRGSAGAEAASGS